MSAALQVRTKDWTVQTLLAAAIMDFEPEDAGAGAAEAERAARTAVEMRVRKCMLFVCGG